MSFIMIKDEVRVSGAANDTIMEEVYLNEDHIVRISLSGKGTYVKLSNREYFHSISTLKEILEQLTKEVI